MSTLDRRDRRTHLALLAPALVALGLVLLYPVGVAVYTSLFKVELLNTDGGEFVGLGNYERLFGSAQFWISLRTTVFYTVATVVGTYVVALVTALVVNRAFRGRSLVRALVILPWAVPQVVAVLVWSWMLDANYGVVNYGLRALGLISENIDWRHDPDWALVSVLFVTVWVLYPMATVMLLAGLNAVPRELYEAAATDGAGPVLRFRHITLPGLRPVNTVLVLLLTLLAFTRVVTVIYVMTGGGSGTQTLPLTTYLQAFKFQHIGYASAFGVVVLGCALVFTTAYLVALRRRAEETG